MKQLSASSLRALIKLDIRSRFGTRKDISKKELIGKIASWTFSLVLYGFFLFFVYEMTDIFVKRSGLGYEWLVMVTTATVIIATIVSIVTVIKNLYLNGDNELLMQFPVTSAEILLSKSIYCFIHNVVVCILVILPFYISFGAVLGEGVSKGFYLEAIVDVLLISLVPYSIANILAVPVMLVTNKLKSRYLIMLILLTVLLVGSFIAYMEIIQIVMKYLQNQSASLFSPKMIENYRAFGAAAYPFKWYANMLSGTILANLSNKEIGLSFLYVALMTIGLVVAGFFVTVKLYYKTILHGIEGTKEAFKLKTKLRVHSPFEALLRREFLLIYRSFNYSFQYLAMAIAAPIMVYYCNNIAVTFGSSSVGNRIVPGLSLLVIIIFSTMIVSFAATTISREGNEFYMTKIIPVKFTTQIGTKFFLYAIVGFASVCFSCLAIGLAFGPSSPKPVVSTTDICAVWGIAEMITLSLTALSVWADVAGPTFNVAGDGEMVHANKNIAIVIFTGIAVAVGYGIFAIVFNYIKLAGLNSYIIDSINDVYVALTLASIVIAGVCFTLLFANLNKRYRKIVS